MSDSDSDQGSVFVLDTHTGVWYTTHHNQSSRDTHAPRVNETIETPSAAADEPEDEMDKEVTVTKNMYKPD